MTIIIKKQYFERAITILTLLGLLTTIHLWIMSERGFDQGCLGFSTNHQFEEMFDCEAVMKRAPGHLFGISNVYWGMLFYALFTVLNFLVHSITGNRQKVVRILRLLFITTGFGYSIFLQVYSYIWIEIFCALCITSAIVCTLIFVVSMIYWRTHSLTLVIQKVHLKFFTSALLIFMFIAMGDILYFNSIALEAKIDYDVGCHYRKDKPVLDNYRDLITRNDIKVGNPDSDVIIIEYLDPNCFHCRTLNRTMKETMEKLSGDALFVFKPSPLWDHSVTQIQALLIASEEDLFWEMLDKQFALQRPRKGLKLEQIKKMAKEIGMDETSLADRIQKDDYLEYITEQKEIRLANKITSAPAVIINGKTVHPKSRTVDCFMTFINEIE